MGLLARRGREWSLSKEDRPGDEGLNQLQLSQMYFLDFQLENKQILFGPRTLGTGFAITHIFEESQPISFVTDILLAAQWIFHRLLR